MASLSTKGLSFSSCLERPCFMLREMRRFQDSVVGSFWAIMVFDGFGPDSFFG